MELSPEQRNASSELARRVGKVGFSEALTTPPEDPDETSLADHIKRTTAAAMLSGAAISSLAITESPAASASTSVVSYEPVMYAQGGDIFPITDETESSEITISPDALPPTPQKDPFVIKHDDPSLGTTIIIPPSTSTTPEEQSAPTPPKSLPKPKAKKPATKPEGGSKPEHRTTKGEMVPDKVDGMVYKAQGDLRWSGKSFNPPGITGRTIAGSGCGPTSLSIVIANLAGEKVTPYQIGQEIIKEGLRVDGGTAHEALRRIPKEHGLNAKFIPPTTAAIDKAFKLDKNTMIIVNGRDDDPNTPASKGGHIYVLSGKKSSGYNVLDPASYWKTLKTHPKRTITGPATMAVAITIPDAMITPEPPKSKKPAPRPPVETHKEQDDMIIPSSSLPTGQFDDASIVQASQTIEVSPEDSAPSIVSDVIVAPPVQPPAEKVEPPSPPSPEKETQPNEKAPAKGEHATTAEKERALQEMIDLGGDWKNRGIALRYLMREGLSAAQAAGVVGNFMVESDDGTGPDVNPRGKQLEGGPGRGIAQWTAKTAHHAGGRWDTDPVNVLDFARKRNLDPWALETQLAFVVYEGRDSNTMWNGTWSALMKTNTPKEAAIAFEKNYEGAGAPAHGPRGDGAQLVYDKYQKLLGK